MKRTHSFPVNLTAGGDSAAIKDAAAAWKARADAGLSAADKIELERWLESDPGHRVALARFDSVWVEFDRPFHTGASDQLMEALDARARRRRRRQVVSSLTGLVALFAAGVVWRTGGGSAAPANPFAARTAQLATVVLLMPERKTLPDGSVVELKEGAKIVVNFSAAVRRVELRGGEAHFQVTKDAARPFVVAASGVEAHAVGTAFAVQMRAGSVEVVVTEGRVAVAQGPQTSFAPAAGSAPASAPLVTLGVSDRIVVNLSTAVTVTPQVTSVPPAELDERLAWRAPRVEFTRTSLAEAIAVLNRYSAERRPGGAARRFVIADDALADVRVSGLFRVDRTEAFVGLLRHGFGIEAESRGGVEILLKPAAAGPP
ncbi:MAG: hypothetical protein RIQ93_331 [Verrucomicrobiota bacterium]|jgi:transmembrane sensor